ncbi:SDR family oxidoreductase [Ectothiorhodospiraceae bacterium WFHF3C12]|nr:SDR family oxidoreductase [Ectothiorhodospiraceae bacterium WFHF3C12]
MTQSDVRYTAVVTGAARGIGRCVATTLARHGYEVMFVDRDGPAVRQAAAEADAPHRVADVGEESGVAAVMEDVGLRWDGLDLLVNNAAIADPFNAPLEDLPWADWQKRLQTNLSGAMLCSKHALPLLRRRRGSIVNMASTRALQSEPHSEAYAASKAGLVGFTHALAVSAGPQVRVNAVSPGWIDTGDWRAEGDPVGEPLADSDHVQHPAGRVGRPEDVAEAVLYLAGSGFVTGANLVVDGGMTRRMIYEE